MKDHHVAPSNCPVCGKLNDMATGVGGTDAPVEGDISVCLTCQSVLRYGPDLRLELPTREQIEEAYTEEPKLRAAVFKAQWAAAMAMDSVAGKKAHG